ncbi:MAG: hypothetical protein IJ043_09340 [Clostridia bacterium]|nr:hypothetical protein [Clostridia bacterium]
MKRLFLLFLTACILLSGCQKQQPPEEVTSLPTQSTGDEAITPLQLSCFGTGRTPPEGETDLSGTYGGQNHSDYRFSASQCRAALWNQYAYYECDPFGYEPWQPRIYRTELGKETRPSLIFNGELIDLFGDILIACDNDRYYALDLAEEGENWIPLQPAGITTAWLEYEGKVLIFGHNSSGSYADIIDLSALTSTRRAVNAPVREYVLEGDILYCIAGDQFCRADLRSKTGQVLCNVPAFSEMDKAGSRILFRKSDYDPLVYDLTTEATFTPKEFPAPIYQCCGTNPDLGTVTDGIAAIPYTDEDHQNQTWYYNIATGQELKEAPTLSKLYPLENGHYTKSETGEFQFCIDGEYFNVRRLPDGMGGTIYANRYGMLCLSLGGIFTADREGNSLHLLHYEILR